MRWLCECRQIADVDLCVLRFTDYGKEFPKSLNMSPDAFIQLALQLTFFKYCITRIVTCSFHDNNVYQQLCSVSYICPGQFHCLHCLESQG